MARFVFTFLILITAGIFTMPGKAENHTPLIKIQSFLHLLSADHLNNINANPPEPIISNGRCRGGGSLSAAEKRNELEEEGQEAEAPVPSPAVEEEGRKILGRRGNHDESSSGKSSNVAGGGVIIGGFVTAFFASLYCYVRVTRTKK